MNEARPRRSYRRVGGVTCAREFPGMPGVSGPLHGLRNVWGWARRGEDHLTAQRRRFGTVYHHMLGNDAIVCVADPDVVESIGRDGSDTWYAAPAWGHYMDGLDARVEGWDGILTLDGTPHRQLRRVLNAALTSARVAEMLDDAAPVVDAAVQRWQARGDVELKGELRALLVQVSALVFLGVDDPGQAARIDAAVRRLWQASVLARFGPVGRVVGTHLLDAYEDLYRAVRRMIQERPPGPDLFSALASARHDVEWLDDDCLARTTISVLLAAFDTTAHSAVSLAALLARHESWQVAVRDEITGSSHELAPDGGLLDACWQESLRLFPVASHIMRMNERDVEVGGLTVPARSLVFGLLGAGNRDETRWPAPDAFVPTRWQGTAPRPALHPFGTGPHACVGARMAQLQVRLIFSRLLRGSTVSLRSSAPLVHCYAPLGAVRGDVWVRLDGVRGAAATTRASQEAA